jgi:hypothetical protein
MLSSLVCEGLSLTVVEVFNYLVSACAVDVWTRPSFSRSNKLICSILISSINARSLACLERLQINIDGLLMGNNGQSFNYLHGVRLLLRSAKTNHAD